MNLLGSTFFLRVTSVQWWSKGYFFLAFYVAKGEQNMEDFFCDLLVLLSTSTAWD